MKIKVYGAIFFILIFRIPIDAQNITGNIEGHIVDSMGVALSEVNVSLRSENLQGIRGTSTDDFGYFQILALPLGFYKVKVSSIGYETITFENVQIALGKTTNLGFVHLKPQPFNLKEVVVSDSKSIIDPASTTYGGSLKFKDFEGLPVDRDYRNMISLLPQANTSYYGDGVNIGGATGRENIFIVDGVDVDDPAGYPIATRLPYNFIKEIELKTGGYEPEFDAATGGLINVVTNSGTNVFHGSVFGYYTNNSFIKHSVLAPSQGNFSNYDIGFSVGGPIIHDKLWFFTAYNPSFNLRDVEVPGFGTSSDRTLIHKFAAKIDWSALQNLDFNLIITGSPSIHNNVGYGVPPYIKLDNPDPYFFDTKVKSANISLCGNYTIKQNLLIQASFSSVRRTDIGTPSTEIGKIEPSFQDNITNTWSGGYPINYNQFRYSNTLIIKGTLQIDKHTINAGLEYKANIVHDNSVNNTIIRKNKSDYAWYYSKSFGEIQYRIPSVFIQDSWRIFSTFRINAGIRFETQSIIGSDGNVDQKVSVPVQPRIGFTFLPSENGSQKIFGSFGRYAQKFGLVQPLNYYNALGYDIKTTYNHNPLIDSSGGKYSYVPYTIKSEIPDLRVPFYDEFSIGYERVIGTNFNVSVQGVYRILREAIDDGYIYSLSRFSIGNPGRGFFSEFPKPERNYLALVFSIEHRFDQHFNFLASYVLSRNYGNYPGTFDSYNPDLQPYSTSGFDDPNYALVNITGLLPNDRTHVFKFSGYYRFLFGLTTGISFDIESGTPLNKYAEQSDYQVFQLLLPRGTAGRTPTTWNLSVRFIYDLNLVNSYQAKIILDIFNIASQLKPVNINQFVYSFDSDGKITTNSAYGKPIRYQDPMSARLGMEVSF